MQLKFDNYFITSGSTGEMSDPSFHQDQQQLSIPEDRPVVVPRTQESWKVVELPPLVDVRSLFSIIKRRFFWLMLIPLLTVALALVWLFKFATLYYESSAMIYVDPTFDRILQVEKVSSIAPDLDSLNSLESAMTSDSMILRVLDKLNLRNDPTYLPKPLLKYAETEVPMNSVRLLKHCRQRYSATLKRPGRVIEFVAYDTDAERAQLIASTFVEEFEAFLGEQKRGEADSTKTELQAQAAEAYDDALESEQQLVEFRKDHPGVTVEQDHDLDARSLTRAGEELGNATSALITLRSKVEAIRDIDPRTDPGKIITVGDFSKLDHVSTLMSQHTSARANFAVISQQYTSRHPKYVEAENLVREVDLQLARLANNLKSAMFADYDGAVKNEAELRSRVDFLKNNLNEVKSISAEFRAIKQKVETKWDIHEQLQKQIGETTLSGEKPTSVINLWSAPMIGYKTTKPNKTLMVLAAGILGCLGSLGLVMLDLFRDGPFANRSQLEDTMGSPVLAQISKKDLKGYSQNMTRAMAQIMLTNQSSGCQIFHVVNSGGKGKTSTQVAAGIANISAYYRAETILIRPYDSGPRGIFHLVPVKTETEGLYQLDIPSSLLLTDDAWHLLSSQCQKFKRVIIDSSSMPADSQLPLHFGRFAHQNIFVVDKKGDSRNSVARAAETFRSICTQPVSVVLVG